MQTCQYYNQIIYTLFYINILEPVVVLFNICRIKQRYYSVNVMVIINNTSVVITVLSVGSIYEIIVTGKTVKEDKELTMTYHQLNGMVSDTLTYHYVI